MKLKTDMTPGFVGTALAAVAAGSLVLFSLVLQQSAFDTSFTDGLKAISPSESELGINVAAAPEENDSAGEGPGAQTPPSEGTTGPAAPTTETDTFSPIDDDLVASIDDPSDDGEFPGASGGTGNTPTGGGTRASVEADGPHATINKDPNGRPDDVSLPDRNGPKNAGSDDDDSDDRDKDSDDDRADDDRDRRKNDRQKARAKGGAKNDRQKSWGKDRRRPQNDGQRSWAKDKPAKKDASKDKPAKKDASKDKSADDKKNAKRNNPGGSNGGGSDSKRDRSSDGDREDREPEDRNDRHDTRKDPDGGEDQDHDDDDDRDDDSGHSNDGSGGHSKSRGRKP